MQLRIYNLAEYIRTLQVKYGGVALPRSASLSFMESVSVNLENFASDLQQ